MKRCLLLVSLVAACGGSSTPAAAPAKPDVCVADPALAATRIAKPADVRCSQWDALGATCNEKKDPDACYQVGVCVKAQELGAKMSPEDRAQHVTAALASLKIACDAGMSEACILHLGVRMGDATEEPADACTEYLRACKLGDENGCFGCRQAGCNDK